MLLFPLSMEEISMTPSPENVPNLWQCLDEFQSSMASIHASLSNPKEKEALGELLSRLQDTRKEAEKLVPQLVQDMYKENEKVKAWAEQALPEIEKMQAELEEMTQAQPPLPESLVTPGAPELPIDPALGQKLRLELLELFGGLGKDELPERRDMGEAWRDWE